MTTASTPYEHGSSQVLGVLLSNLGTPDAPTADALRRYLAEFLWDPRVVDLPRPLWWLILHGVILRIRPRRSARAYERVWTEAGSPLLAISERQTAALREVLNKRLAGRVVVELGMRYGNPSLESALDRLHDAGARRLLLLPLYPQYSAVTTASTFDAVAASLRRRRWIPELRMVAGYHTEPGYIGALAASIRDAWKERPAAEKLVFSFHGVPRRHLIAGDPYHCFCHATARLVAAELGLAEERWITVFQSRFGREEWLRPYADQSLQAWAKGGLKTVDIVCPGFSADCLETLEEMAETNRDLFLESGGQDLRYIAALNDRADHVEFLAHLVERHTAGWPEAMPDFDPAASERSGAESRTRALAMGAAS